MCVSHGRKIKDVKWVSKYLGKSYTDTLLFKQVVTLRIQIMLQCFFFIFNIYIYWRPRSIRPLRPEIR
jgi:hypothetical protein